MITGKEQTNMMKKLVWRLGKLPTPDEVRELVKDKIITQDEAREILFSSETAEERDKKSLEDEIKFLRDLVEKLSKSKEEIVKYITIEKPVYIQRPWFQPYWNWCGDSINLQCSNGTTSLNTYANKTTRLAFNSINTF